ncbi:MAG: PEP-CTERM sorting domain-containing protein, partial [Akkermansiaceae bacterium]
DGQDATNAHGNGYNNSSHDASSLTYTTVNSIVLPTTGGKRVTSGTGDPNNDYFAIGGASSGFDTAGLYDAVSGSVGGGAVSGSVYLGFLMRAPVAAGPSVENSYSALQLGITGGSTAVGIGNHWNAWAYSIFGTPGNQDLIQGTGGSSWLNYDTNTHWAVAKITFNANADDDFTVWLDPNPADGDSQQNGVRRFSGTAVGSMAFDEISYRAGNGGTDNAWEFDEVRFTDDWASLTANPVPEPSSSALLALAGVACLLRRRK